MGRKRFILVDTLGLLLAVIVTQANFSERLGGVVVVDTAIAQLSQVERKIMKISNTVSLWETSENGLSVEMTKV